MSSKALIAGFQAHAAQLSPKLRTWRRHLHAHPELSFAEQNTQGYLLELLSKEGISNVVPIAETGVLVTLSGEGSGAITACVALRADIDALPIQEVAGRSYGSQVPNVMHACGHDVHTTCALGAVLLLHQARANWAGTVKVIFQPGEEVLPGGATKVIAAGGLLNPDVQSITALHVAPELEVGCFGYRLGPYMASSDELHLRLSGSGGHAALAHRHTDLIATAAHLITGLQQVVSRKAPPAVPTVLSFGSVSSAGGATNVLATSLTLKGTFRTYDQAWREQAHTHIERIAAKTAEMFGAHLELEIRQGYPALANDTRLGPPLVQTLQQLVGEEQVQELELRPTAEDFAWYLQEVPGFFFRLGVGNAAKGISASVHQPDFDVDEACLTIGATALAACALKMLTEAEATTSALSER